MEDNGPSGRVTSSAGDIGADGNIVGTNRTPGRYGGPALTGTGQTSRTGLVSGCGTSLTPPRYVERPDLAARLALACGGNPTQARAVRRMLGLDPECRCGRRTCVECRGRHLSAVAS